MPFTDAVGRLLGLDRPKDPMDRLYLASEGPPVSDSMSLDRVVGTILTRDKFRYDRFNYAFRVFFSLCCLLLVSVVGNVSLMGTKDRFQYLMTDPYGRLMRLVPLDQANMSDEDLQKWTVDAITRINTFDFANFRQQFDYAQRVLTGVGWAEFQKALKESGNFNAVIQNRYVTTAVPSGPARVVSQGMAKGIDGTIRYTWSVTFPMIVTYRSSKQSISQGLTVTAQIVRMPEFINHDGLGIRQVIGQQF